MIANTVGRAVLYGAAVFSMWLALCEAGPARAQESGTELFQYCTVLERGVRSGPSGSVALPRNYDAFICWGFMSAIQDMTSLSYDGGNTLTGGCAHPDAKLLQYVYAFNNYARTHPGELHEKAGWVAIKAIREAFPCRVRGGAQ
jgi:hypothetical protein